MGRFRALDRVVPILLVPAILILCGGCGDRPEDAVPPSGGIYRLPLTDNPVTLDPARFTGVNSEGVARRIFNSLVRLDEQLRPVPDLAQAWEASADGLTYTFRLRKGVRFHNGREVTAKDVQYSLERLLRKETVSKRAWVVAPIAGAEALREGKADSLSGVTVVDAHQLTIRLREPFTPFLSQLAMTNAAIVPREEVERPGSKFGRHPVGTGPFKFVEWRDDDFLLLERNEGYFLGPPELAGIRFRVIKVPAVAFEEYMAGNLEHCAVPEEYLEGKIRGTALAKELRSVATLSTYYLGITMNHDPCGKNVHLRRAMNYAVDRRFLCRKVLGGSHVPAKGILPPGLPGYDEGLEGYRYDPARAKEELKAAGFGGERQVPELRLHYANRPPGGKVAQAIQHDLKRVGIHARLVPMDLGALFESVNRSKPDLFRLSWIADFPDADNFLYIFHSRMHGSSGNRARYTNTEVDALLDRARREVAADRRIGMLKQVERRIVADAPWIFLSHKQTQLLVKPYVRNFTLTAMDVGTSVNQVDFHKVSLGAAE